MRCRFLGELTKFGLCPKSEALHCLKLALFDFRHHSVDMACQLLDSCGFYLYHSVDSHQRSKFLLELMRRKRNAQGTTLDQRFFSSLSLSLSVCLSVRPSVCLLVRPSVCLSACLSVCLSVCLFVRPSHCLSVCLTVFLLLSVSLLRLPVRLSVLSLSLSLSSRHQSSECVADSWAS